MYATQERYNNQREEARHERLGALLKHCRSRIPSECRSLGHFHRQAARVGKPVTQGEVAEASGISRQWYVLMENDRSVRVSGKALSRIAEALGMSSAERVSLFRLAVPELRSLSFTQRSKQALDAIAPFRPLMRKLWAASSAAQALTIAREYALTEFGSHAVITSTRGADGRWESALSGIEHECSAQLNDLLCGLCGAAATDYSDVPGLMTLPGQALTRRELDARFPEAAAKLRRILDGVNCADLSIAMVNLRSRHGLQVSFMLVNYQLREFTVHERTELRTLAGIVALALPG